MTLSLIRRQDWQTQRWQNGAGITHQLARFDDDNGMLWRLSIAEVASDGPFSRFENINRIILLLDGAGFCLHGVGDCPQRLDQRLKPFAFCGETAIHCALLDGPVRDFNLMSRKDELAAAIETITLSTVPAELVLSATHFIYVVSGSVEARFNGQRIALSATDLLQLQHENSTVQLSSNDGAALLSCTLR